MISFTEQMWFRRRVEEDVDVPGQGAGGVGSREDTDALLCATSGQHERV